jgi:hypothetical protein
MGKINTGQFFISAYCCPGRNINRVSDLVHAWKQTGADVVAPVSQPLFPLFRGFIPIHISISAPLQTRSIQIMVSGMAP